MHVGLFIPCYIDLLFPQVGLNTARLLRRSGVEIDYPMDQTCCGQPMANMGCVDSTAALAHRFARIFEPYSHVVCPSGSCVAMVRHHYAPYFEDSTQHRQLAAKTFELCEFLVDVQGWRPTSGAFPYRTALHPSCHALRELRLGPCSERSSVAVPNRVRQLLDGLDGIEWVEPERRDECCGFGGTFCVSEAAVSTRMGTDRIDDFIQAGAEILTAVDMSCLMHLQGLVRRQNRSLRIMHVADILIEATRP